MFETSVYKNRRARLKEKVKSGLVLILGNGEAPANYTDNTYKFRQDSSFLYFFGLNQPGFAGVIDIDSGDEYIFGNDVDMDDIICKDRYYRLKDYIEQPSTVKYFISSDQKTIYGLDTATNKLFCKYIQES